MKVPTEAVLEAVWAIVEVLGDRSMRWVDLAAKTGWSDPTLRRASGLLQRAGVIVLDRYAVKWSRVQGVEIPAQLLPRFALVRELNERRASAHKALRLVHDEYVRAKTDQPDSWSGPAFARALQLFCEGLGVPLEPASWTAEPAEKSRLRSS